MRYENPLWVLMVIDSGAKNREHFIEAICCFQSPKMLPPEELASSFTRLHELDISEYVSSLLQRNNAS
jgi:hypothetical protein